MSSPTFLSQSVDWFLQRLDTLVKTETNYEIASFVRVFNTQDSFNQEFFKDSQIIYPFVSYQVKDVSLATDRLGSIQSRQKGISLSNVTFKSYPKPNVIEYAVDATNQRIKQARVLPITLNVTLTFITNTPQQYEEFLLTWLNIYPVLSELILFEDDIELPVSAIPTIDGLNYPEKETDDKGEYYKGEFNFTLHTFTGNITDVAAIKAREEAVLSSDSLKDKTGQTISNIIKVSS